MARASSRKGHGTSRRLPARDWQTSSQAQQGPGRCSLRRWTLSHRAWGPGSVGASAGSPTTGGGLLVPSEQVWVTPESRCPVARVRVIATARGTEYFSTSDPCVALCRVWQEEEKLVGDFAPCCALVSALAAPASLPRDTSGTGSAERWLRGRLGLASGCPASSQPGGLATPEI